MGRVPMNAKTNTTRKEIPETQLSAEYKELLDIVAEIIAFDMLKKTENDSKENQNE